MIPAPALDYYATSLRLQLGAAQVALRFWRRVDPRAISSSWGQVVSGTALTGLLSAAQVNLAGEASTYGAQTLAEQGLSDPVEAFVNPAAFGGYTGAGAPLESLLLGAAPYTKSLIGGGLDDRTALAKGGEYLANSVKTAVADAGRAAAGVDTFARKRTGYVRMLNPPSCQRCAVLAGKFYRHNTGFKRHRRCDCVHVPTQENVAGSVSTDPYAYFESLSEAEQNKIFTRAGAQAIRDGGDIFQVVNARRGMSENGLTTLAGMGRKGHAQHVVGAGGVRLTPEGIYRLGLSREAALSLLEKHAYILPGGQDPLGVLAPHRANFKNTMTAAEKRLQQARLNWQAVLQGRHPQSGRKLTPAVAARYEDQYRYWLARKGERFTQ